MLHEAVADPGAYTGEELLARYEDELRAAIDETGTDAAIENGAAADVVAALADGDSPDVALTDAAAILAAREDAPDADAIVIEARDDLLMGMSMAVLDVETLASELDGALEPKEIQAMIEGRFPMGLREFALIKGAIESRRP